MMSLRESRNCRLRRRPVVSALVLGLVAPVAILFATAALPAHAAGVRIRERGNPGAVLQVFLSITLPGGSHVRLTQPNGQPWSLTIGPDGTGTLDFSGNVNVRDPNGNQLTIPASAIQDFDQYFQGIRVGGGPVQNIAPDAAAALQGAYLGLGPTFDFASMPAALPAEPAFVPAPDFLSDLNNDSTVTAAENIFAAVNLSLWAPVATTLPIGTSFIVTNGTSAALPGYYFSQTLATFDSSSSTGWASSSPLNGTVFVVAQHELSAIVPEPASLGLLLLGIGGLGGAQGARVIVRRRQTARWV